MQSFALKLARADGFQAETQEIGGRWVQATTDSAYTEQDPGDPGMFRGCVNAPPLPEDDLSIAVGDCLQCRRTALDHLAFALAAEHTRPMTPALERTSEFPIFSDREAFHRVQSKGSKAGLPAPSSGLAKIAGWSPAAQAAVELLQPYHLGAAYENHPLWQLSTLNNIDKHRSLHLVAATTTGIFFDPARSNATITPPPEGGYLNPMEVEVDGFTVYAEIRGTVTATNASLPMRLVIPPALSITFGPGTPIVAREDVLVVLERIRRYVAEDVVPALAPHL